jgi:hypothetical protein
MERYNRFRYMVNMKKEFIEINPFSIEQQVKEQLEYFKSQLLKLNRYQPTFEGLMEESEEYGEYIKLEDILNLFSAKKI